ncbi:MAG: SIR2 family protein [Saprospiraceae bacterium]|nr:SIR2 family protein [Saprospiraceae bacterium]
MIIWPKDLIEDVARRRSVIILGAGVSKNSVNRAGERPKDWEEFLRSACDETPNVKTEVIKLLKSKDYLTACEVIKKDLGRDDFNTILKREFLTAQFEKAEIHEHIYNLDSRIIITPNFDKIFDGYANAISHGSTIIKQYYDTDIADCIRRPERLIIKIHGSIDSPDNLIFTRKDYAEARVKHSSFYHIINALSITHTFIFIGCGLNDPDIRLILENYSFRFIQNRKHFMVLPKESISPKLQEIIGETMSLKIIPYESSNHHSKLTDSMKELKLLVEEKRDELANNRNW